MSAPHPVHLVHLVTCAPQPWRNGGGITRELLVWPPLHSAHAWHLRVSVADIEADGPFSPFPGVLRWFAVLRGAGVRLALPHGTETLAPHDTPVAFEGEDAPDCTLVDGPTRDLNFMARRGQGVARMRIATPGSTLEGDRPFRALYAVEPAQLEIEDRTEALPAGTLAWTDTRDAAAWTLRAGRHALWLTLEDA